MRSRQAPPPRSTSPSGRRRTPTAPRRLSAATTVSAVGRGSMRTPTCSPWWTPIEIRPRTIESMRCLAAAWVWARSSKRKKTCSGWSSACSSRSFPSEIRVRGRTWSRRIRRGSSENASEPIARTLDAVRAAPREQRSRQVRGDPAGEREAVAGARRRARSGVLQLGSTPRRGGWCRAAQRRRRASASSRQPTARWSRSTPIRRRGRSDRRDSASS